MLLVIFRIYDLERNHALSHMLTFTQKQQICTSHKNRHSFLDNLQRMVKWLNLTNIHHK